jgi:GT2 family glycosyltransferase/glycosyltransferase involved in cell wall biosynthesis
LAQVRSWRLHSVRDPDLIRVAFACGTAQANAAMLAAFEPIRRELPLHIVSEFAPSEPGNVQGEWIPYHPALPLAQNTAGVQAALEGKTVGVAAVMLDPHPPLRPMQKIASAIGASETHFYDAQGNEIPPALARLWRARARVRGVKNQFASGGRARRWLHRLAHPADAEVPIRARAAQAYGAISSRLRKPGREPAMGGTQPLARGVTVIVPSRDGCELLERLFASLWSQLTNGEVIVVDNGSRDGVAKWLNATRPTVRVIRTEAPLSFSRAVNMGLEQARFDRVLLLNNDMIVESGFVEALEAAFDRVPELFCATAQIFFPAGARREETGKAVWRRESPIDLPLRCDEPVAGEDLTWVLYGSGGCSLYDTAKLRALGGMAELFEPAYVEDLDAGFRAWKRGWPSVFVRRARVEHRHRTTTSRFFSGRELEFFVQRNFLRFLVHAVGSPALFRQLWRDALRRLQLRANAGDGAALDVLRAIPNIGPRPSEPQGSLSESEILALGSGDVAVFPGRERRHERAVVVASPYLPFPLSHGGAVRIYNLMRAAADKYDHILVCFCDELTPPAAELSDICAEVVLVRRHGTHLRRNTKRPDVVEEFDSETFRACLKQTIWKWRAGVAQLEFTWMAQYADACSPVKTILVEHDITFDLQQQLLATRSESGLRRHELVNQLEKWRSFEIDAWKRVDAVATMSAKDSAVVRNANAVKNAKRVVTLRNGVDTSRFSPGGSSSREDEPETKRLLFIGSFAHLPNVLALDFFLREVFPLLSPGYKLHVIAGSRPEYYLDFHRARVSLDLARPWIELEAFVSDVRQAYRRAEIVLAPLTASAGTNIKVLEAMAMGRAVVSTPAGINGLDLENGKDVIVTASAQEMAAAIEELSHHPERRREIERNARNAALAYDWREIGAHQCALYDQLYAETP